MTSNGDIRWEPGGVFQTMCQIDITYYPFDHQRCELQFGAWSYHTNKMNLTNLEPKVNLVRFFFTGPIFLNIIYSLNFIYLFIYPFVTLGICNTHHQFSLKTTIF